MKFIRDSFFGIFVIVIVLSMLVPTPPFVLDFLIALNIMISLVIILNAIYSKEILDMSLFPTILLVTTLFRTALNVNSMRAILSEGYAGEVIEAFGSFVAAGNPVVGTVVFIILIIVNLMIITKGSERVAEVTARFTLDAIPGKQMAVDADLNAGFITEDEAKARRKKIQDESTFFGAMDGASKFVKGDVVAGILITLVNIIAGVAVGMTMMGMDFGSSLNLFLILTIGDGLVSQIPSILISMATGILVTKATADDDITAVFTRQLFSKSRVLYIGGLAMLFLGIFTPMPWEAFVPIGLVMFLVAYMLDKKQVIRSIETEITAEDQTIDEIRKLEDAVSLLGIDPILINLGYGLIPFIDEDQGGDIKDRLVMIRRQIVLDNGALVPPIRVRDNIRLSPNEYNIHIKGVEIAGGEIMFGHYMAINPGYVEEEIDGIETVEPHLGIPALWISENQRERAEALGYSVVDPPAIIISHLTEIIKEKLHELLTRQDVQTLIDKVKEKNSVLIEELIPRMMSVGEIQKVLSNLLREGVSIRDLVTIMETLADNAGFTRDTDILTEQVRERLRRSISKRFLANDINTVISLDPSIEQIITDSIKYTEQGSFAAIEPKLTHMIFDKVKEEATKLSQMGIQPIIVTSPLVRTYFKKLIEPIFPDIIVLSHTEVDSNVSMQYIGMVSM